MIYLIFRGQTDKEHCGPVTIASFNVKQAIELAQQQGLPQYKERACTASAVPAWKSPTVQLKVTVPPWAMNSCSMGGAQAMALDYTAGYDEEIPFPEASRHWVMRGSPKKVWPDPMYGNDQVVGSTCRNPGGGRCPVVAAGCTIDRCSVSGTRELAKHFLAAWQWTVEVAATNFCLPTPTMLNISQFLDEELEEGDHMPWLLAYTHHTLLGAHTCAPCCGAPHRSFPSCQGGGNGAGATTGGKGV